MIVFLAKDFMKEEIFGLGLVGEIVTLKDNF